MSLPAGKRLGSFEIKALIGSGGMGEVYRAKDLKLGRDVAIKALPDLFSKDKERLSRFDREARLLASLNHPNIATIYGLEESDGEHYLVLELVEGETLAERLNRGPIPLGEALPLFMQIAEALETAHEKGIIHRDLKPANIKVTPEGKAKVLDFGLAKALAGDVTTDSGLSESPTITKDATGTGVLLGTAPYMSPEQARGKDVDKRADIWAFGCCLYEALTGKVAFLGETVSDTIARILKEDPDWSLIPPQTPFLVKSLLQRCLRKNAQKRLHDIADARLEIEEALSEPSPEMAIAQTGLFAQRRFKLWGLAPIFVGLIAGGLIVHLATRPGPPTPHRPQRLNVYLPSSPRMMDWTSGYKALAISPDGTRVVFAGLTEEGRQLYERPLDRLEIMPIPGTEAGHNPFFSPDSQWLGFTSDGKLRKVPLRGGEPIVVCDAKVVRGASWGGDDTIIFGAGDNGLARVPSDGGTPELIATPDTSAEEWSYQWPQFLPDENVVFFSTMTMMMHEEDRTIAVVSLETGEKKVLVEGGTDPKYLPTGHLLFTQAGSIFAAPFDLKRLQLSGDPVPVINDVHMIGSGSGVAYYDVSASGSMVYVPGFPRPVDRTLLWIDRQGNTELITEDHQPYGPLSLSPDGSRLAVSITEPSRQSDIWIYDLDRLNWARLTFTGYNWSPLWTPDGQRVVFASTREKGLFSTLADGSGQTHPLAKGDINDADIGVAHPSSFTPDGTTIFFHSMKGSRDYDIRSLNLEIGPSLQPYLVTPFLESQGVISPDGRWVAYTSSESGRAEVYVKSLSGTGRKWSISTGGGFAPLWSRDGRELFYQRGSQVKVVSIQTEPNFEAGTPRTLFHVPRAWAAAITRRYDVTPDGKRFVMIQEPEKTAEPLQIVYIPDWFEELEQLAPKN
jgi:serine/threonine-protein kinase